MLYDLLVTVWNQITVTVNAIEYPFWNSPVLLTVYFRGGVWLFILIVSIVSFARVKSGEHILPLIPLLLVMLMLMISCPAQDFRYVLPMMEIGVFLIVLIPAVCGLVEVDNADVQSYKRIRRSSDVSQL